jgi:Asp-tRNA(Asn)/Glu-tRNA(Gln) amidotransferase A subunit family amidase
VGLQLVAPAFAEARLLAIAHGVESVVGRLTLPVASQERPRPAAP